MVNITSTQLVFALTLYGIMGAFIGAVIMKLVIALKEDKKEEVEPVIITCREVDND